MNVTAFLDEIRSAPGYREQVVHVRDEDPRPARFAEPREPLPAGVREWLASRGIDRLWSHQARAVDLAREGRNVLVTTGTASGKSLCYLLPMLEALAADRSARVLLLHPTKALSRDQLRVVTEALVGCGLGDRLAGVCDGDTPGALRRRIRDRASVVLTNPDMLHAAILPEHGRWGPFLAGLRLLVVDEIHTLSGIFGSNAAHLFHRLFRVCRHHGSDPATIACSATIGNPVELSERLTGKSFARVAEDGSPRGRRTYVFWNPPRVRNTRRRARRSANVEAQDLTAALVKRGVPTITFSKAKITAELIHRYVRETLGREAPGLANKVSPYRGGLLPEERREIEERLFRGDLLAVSTTRALELGIDVGAFEACVIAGYPGTLASFFQQAGRAGRRDAASLVVLVGLDTAVNQFVLRNPSYVFDRPVEEAVIDPENPFVLTGHLRCAAQELPISEEEAAGFAGPARLVLGVLEENRKVRRIRGSWYHAAGEIPQHEVSLRDVTDRNVVIEEEGTRRVLGEISKFDAPAVVHEEAVYLHRGETYLVRSLDTERSLATVARADVDYYTQSHGGDCVHHVDHRLREKPFGAGRAAFGEVTAHYWIDCYEKVRFWTLDAVSWHGLPLRTYPIETTAFWIVPPESVLSGALREGLDAVGGLRGIGYALRKHLPLLVTCDTLDLSHSIGSVNTPWQAIFVWEHYPKGLGFTAKGYERLHELLPAARDTIRRCACRTGGRAGRERGDGCPRCVGKPLRPDAVLNPERGEGSIPSRRAALRILDGLLAAGDRLDLPDDGALTDRPEAEEARLARAVRRRLESRREPDILRPPPIGDPPGEPPGWPDPEPESALDTPDAIRRGARRRAFHRRLR